MVNLNTIINDAFRRHFLFGVSSKISSFWHYFTDKALNKILSLFAD
jgi:hypothetical protein